MSFLSTYSVSFRRPPRYRFSHSLFHFVSHEHRTSRRFSSSKSRPPPHHTTTTAHRHSFVREPSLDDGSSMPHPSPSSTSSSSSFLPTRYPLDFVGAFQTNWLDASHPYRIRTELLPSLCSRGYLPNFSDYMACSPYEALLEVAANRPYHDVLQLIMEHSFFFLLDDLGFVLIGAPDAPLPHVVYEDVLKVLTFASLQRPAEEQFQLSSSFRFVLLAQVARICLHDAAYLYQARRLFRRMEQQQTLVAEDYALMVWIYASAKDVVSCFHLLLWMTELSIASVPTSGVGGEEVGRHPAPRWTFSPKVFSFLQHPSVNVCELLSGHTPHVVKGLLWQQRLAQAWAEASLHPISSFRLDDGEASETRQEEAEEAASPFRRHPHTFAMGVHAVFLHYVLTQQVSLQWRWLGMAFEKEATYWPSAASLLVSHGVFSYSSSSSSSSSFMEGAAGAGLASPLPLFGEPMTTTTTRRHPTPSSLSLRGVFLVSPRTLRIAVDIIVDHQGRHCPPLVMKQLFLALVRRGEGWRGGGSSSRAGGASCVDSRSSRQGAKNDTGGEEDGDPVVVGQDASLSALLLFLLMRVRRNELHAFSTSSSSSSSSFLCFTAEEVEWVCVTLERNATPPSTSFSARRKTHEDEGRRMPVDEEDVDEGKDWQTALALPLLRGLMTTSFDTASTPGDESGAERRMSSYENPSSSPPRLASWKKLLQECAAFGKQVLHEKSAPEAHTHLSPSSSSSSSFPTAVSPASSSSSSASPTTSRMTAFAHARLLFRSIQALDQRGLSSASVSSGAPLSPDSPQASENRVDPSVQEQEERVEAVLVAMQRAGASASQQYFTAKVMEEEKKEEEWRRQLQEDSTTLWTAL